MSTHGSLVGLKLFEGLNVEYEHAYKDNEFKKACITAAISLLAPDSRVLDVGCGTGVPVSSMLSKAGLTVVGFDISPQMVKLATDRVPGSFTVSDMLTYQPEGQFAAVFMIFCHLQLSYADFHAAAYKFAQTLKPGGILVFGQRPADKYVADAASYDETGTYVEDYDAPFMGNMVPGLAVRADGQRDFFRSMGLEIVWESVDIFQPRSEKCVPEHQQYIIARWPGEQELNRPGPLPHARK
jgi:SAM-dependent methyltransferase